MGIAEPDTVGEHQGAVMDAERLATHYFTCTAAAYPGWRWAVTLARAPRSKKATVCETNLVPGEGALLSPEWLPYDQRLRPGDIGPGDVVPYIEEDQRLVAGFEATGDEDVDQARPVGAGARSQARAVRKKVARKPPSGGTTATTAPRRRSRSRRPHPARPAGSSCRWRVHSALFSASAPTPGRLPTVAS